MAALTWLKQHDPSYYYIDVGGANPEWKWMPVSYSLEIPTLNFQYNRRVSTQDKQRSPESPFVVTAKYRFTRPDQPPPPGGQYLNEFAGFKLYQMPTALPFAFSVPESRLQSPGKITASDVVPLSGGAQGPNRYVVMGSGPEGSRLVALVSNYPGWRVFVDGRPAPLAPANGYLGVTMQPGEHTYTFIFSPILHTIGVVVSLVTLAGCLVLLGLDFRLWRRNRRAARSSVGTAVLGPMDTGVFGVSREVDEGQGRWGLLPDDERDVQRELRALRHENETLRASLAALGATAVGGSVAETAESQAEQRVAESSRMIQVRDLKRLLPWLVLAVPLVLALAPAFLVFQDRWARNQGLVEMYRGTWSRLPFAPILGLPPYFYIIFLCLALLILVMLVMRRLAPLSLYIPTERVVAPMEGLSRLQRQAAYGLLSLSLLGALYVVGTSIAQRRQPGWDLALVLVGLLLGAFLREIPVQRVVGWLQRSGPLLVTVLMFEIALLLFMRAIATRQGDITVYGLLLGLAAVVLLMNWRRLGWVFWIMQGAFIAYTYQINGWWFAAIGDEFSFYRYAREIVERQSLDFIGSKLFWGSAVYGTHPYISSLIQALWMKLLGTDSFGWRISNLYLSALSLPFFYYFFKTFIGRRLAILTTIFLAASHYVMDFGKIGYNNLQALFIFGLVLLTVAWAIQSTRPLAFLALGLSMGLCFHVYPAALYVVPIPLLLLLFYYFPRSWVAAVKWGVSLGSMTLFIFPLLSQPEYWQSKTAGTMFNGPSLVENIVKAATHIGTNMLYALFSPLFAAEESHFVVVSHVDLIQAALVFIGLAYLLSRPRQNRFVVFFLLSYVALLFLVGASHDRRYPPNTRMFLMLPWYAFMATVGLTWLVERLKGLGLPERRAAWTTALVIVTVVVLNLVHAYPFSYNRNGGRYQSLEVMFLRTAQLLFTPDQPQRTVAWVNDPQSLHIPSLREGAEMYGLPSSPDRIKEIVVNGPALPPTAKPTLDDRNVIVAVSPRIQDAWRQPIERSLQEQGRVRCTIKNMANDPRFDLWLPQGMEGMCRELLL